MRLLGSKSCHVFFNTVIIQIPQGAGLQSRLKFAYLPQIIKLIRKQYQSSIIIYHWDWVDNSLPSACRKASITQGEVHVEVAWQPQKNENATQTEHSPIPVLVKKHAIGINWLLSSKKLSTLINAFAPATLVNLVGPWQMQQMHHLWDVLTQNALVRSITTTN